MTATLANRLGTSGFPAYVRKVDKRSSWGDECDPFTDRLALALASVFPESQRRFSVFIVRSDDELKRVVVGLNMYRDRPNDQIDLVAFTESEIAFCGINIDDTPGDTSCHSANKLHADVLADDYIAYSRLCTAAFKQLRTAFRVTKGEAKRFAHDLKAFGCEAFDGNEDCSCKSEN